MNPTPHLELLKQILRAKSVRFGDFTLASGEKSSVYVDCKLTTCSPQAMPMVGEAFLSKIRAAGWSPKAVGGLTLGADPIAFAIARESLSGGQPISAFIVRKEPKKHGMQRFIEGLDDTKDLPVVIIDDVCTTGISTTQAIEKARAAGMKILGAICLVDREMGARDLLAREWGCDLKSVFTLTELKSERHESPAAHEIAHAAV